MPQPIDIPQEQTNLVPIRHAYFSKEFWDRWDKLSDRQKAAFLLGWVAELEAAIRKMSEQLNYLRESREDESV